MASLLQTAETAVLSNIPGANPRPGQKAQFPNSYHSKAPTTDTTPSFDGTAVETPMQVASNVLSRTSHYRHEGQPSAYRAAEDCYLNQLDAQGKADLHLNMSRLLKPQNCRRDRQEYLAHPASAPSYHANGVSEALPEKPKTFKMAEVAEASKTAHLVGKNP
ncbi:hypothetical protein JCM10295v2_001643 [Rhodotorula toruloides]